MIGVYGSSSSQGGEYKVESLVIEHNGRGSMEAKDNLCSLETIYILCSHVRCYSGLALRYFRVNRFLNLCTADSPAVSVALVGMEVSIRHLNHWQKS